MINPSLVIGITLCATLLITTSNAAPQGQSLKDLLAGMFGPSDNDATPIRTSANAFVFNRAPASLSSTSDPRFDVQKSELIASNVLALAHDISRTLLVDSKAKSEVFSPISIYSALSLLLLGANGDTFEQLLRLMRLDQDSYLAQNPWKIHEEMGLLLEDLTLNRVNENHKRVQPNWKVSRGPVSRLNRNELSDYKLTVANGLFVQNGYSLRPDYRSAVLGVYRSNMQNLDFEGDLLASVRTINSWVNDKTEGLIPKIISDQLSSQTRMVLASALYFNAMWEKTFLEEATRTQNFYPDGLSNPPIPVEMMASGGNLPFYESTEYDCRIIGLPYKHNLTTMFIILPNNSDRGRLRQMQEYLTADKIEEMISQMEWKSTILLMPKMHTTNELNLKRVLQQMGLHALFEPTISDLSLISNGFGTEQEAHAGHSFVPHPVLSHNLQDRFVSTLNADDDEDSPFIFSRHGEDDEDTTTNTTATTTETARERRSVSYKAPSDTKSKDTPLRLKDYIISKRVVKPISKTNNKKSSSRPKRQIDLSQSLKQLDGLRNQLRSLVGGNPGLYAEEIVHKVDLTINEKGTEGGAATVTTLYRTGTDVVMRVETPFIFLVRHDETRLPLFYGTVYEP